MAGGNGSPGWSRGRILTIVIPLCVALIVLMVILIVVVGNSEEETAASQDELLKQYDEVKKEADEAFKQMEDLGSEQAAADAEAFDEELNEAYAAMSDLYQDLDEAAQATEDAAEQVSETNESYEELYQEMLAFYDYLEQMYEQALAQLQYLQSVAPTLEELYKLENVVEKLERLPAAGTQFNELSAQLVNRAAGAGDSYQGALTAPDSLGTFSSGLSELTVQIEGLSQQMSQALAGGDQQTLTACIQQLAAGISSLEQRLAGDLSAMVNEFSSQIQSLSAAVNAAMP